MWRVKWNDLEEGVAFRYVGTKTEAQEARADLEAQAVENEDEIDVEIERIVLPTDKVGLIHWLNHNADKVTMGCHTYSPRARR